MASLSTYQKHHLLFLMFLVSTPGILSGCSSYNFPYGLAGFTSGWRNDSLNSYRELNSRHICPPINPQLLSPSSIQSKERKLHLNYQVSTVRLLSGKMDKPSQSTSETSSNTNQCYLPDGINRKSFELALGRALKKASYVETYNENHKGNYLLVTAITEQSKNTGPSVQLSMEYKLINPQSGAVLLSKTFKTSRNYHDNLFSGEYSPALFMELHLAFSDALDSLLYQLGEYEKLNM